MPWKQIVPVDENETPAERLLRGIADIQFDAVGPGPEVAAIDLGREALALWRELFDGPIESGWRAHGERLYAKADALLARAGDRTQ